jgi:tripartite-type tricarboxylate transporter receptor subunit TctC
MMASQRRIGMAKTDMAKTDMAKIDMAKIDRRTLLAGLAAASLPRAARAEADYPNRFVSLIVPFGPGGASDFVARIIQPKLTEKLGQQIVILNRPGAAGNIGMTDAARAEPDGYTLFLGNVGNVAINPSVYGKLLRISPERDLAPITLLADAPDVLIANSAFAPSSVKEMVDYVKAHPGEVNYGSPGAGSLNRLEMEVFRDDAGLKMTHVAYKGGAGEAAAAVVGGEVPVMFSTMSSAISFIRANQLKALAVTSAERARALPDVPTMVESGYANMVASSWQGMFVPSKTPEPIVAKLYATLIEVMADKDVETRLFNGGVDVRTSKSPQDAKAYIDGELQRWTAVVKTAGITAQ